MKPAISVLELRMPDRAVLFKCSFDQELLWKDFIQLVLFKGIQSMYFAPLILEQFSWTRKRIITFR